MQRRRECSTAWTCDVVNLFLVRMYARTRIRKQLHPQAAPHDAHTSQTFLNSRSVSRYTSRTYESHRLPNSPDVFGSQKVAKPLPNTPPWTLLDDREEAQSVVVTV